jgi:tetratricopeptide (TPR) repeat protein
VKPEEQAKRHFDKGMKLYREKRDAEALAEFQNAARLDPKDPQAVNNVGFVLFRMGKYGEAIEWLKKTLSLDPKRAVAWLNLGDTCEAAGDKPQAVAAWQKYIELAPASRTAAKLKEKIARLK